MSVVHGIGEFAVFPVRIHILSDLPGRFGQLRIGGVGDIDEADLVALAVPAARQRLVAKLEPVRPDHGRIAQRSLQITLVGDGTFLLVPHRAEAGREHAAVVGAEVEFTDQHRLAEELIRADVRDAVVVAVDADHIGILRGDAADRFRVAEADEAAAEVEAVRRQALDPLARQLEIAFDEFVVERIGVLAEPFAFGHRLALQQAVPVGIGGVPHLVEGFDGTVFRFQVLHELQLGGLVRLRPEHRFHDTAEGQFIVDEVADAHRVVNGFAGDFVHGGAVAQDVPHLDLEFRVVDIVELHLAVAEARQFLREIAQLHGIGDFPLEHEVAVRPVADGVDAPCLKHKPFLLLTF